MDHKIWLWTFTLAKTLRLSINKDGETGSDQWLVALSESPTVPHGTGNRTKNSFKLDYYHSCKGRWVNNRKPCSLKENMGLTYFSSFVSLLAVNMSGERHLTHLVLFLRGRQRWWQTKMPTLFPISMAVDPVNLKKCWVTFSLSVSFPTYPAGF